MTSVDSSTHLSSITGKNILRSTVTVGINYSNDFDVIIIKTGVSLSSLTQVLLVFVKTTGRSQN